MKIEFSPAQLAFREEVRAFFKVALPEDLRRKTLNGEKVSKDEHIRWHRILRDKGWLAPSWSVEYGGTGWDPVQRFIYDEEYSIAGAPKANVPAIDLMGPVLIEFGTDAQKATYLPAILSSEHWWCQGFSEPGAGSDLASLTTRATVQGDEFVINGAKIWTSHAHMANQMFCLARTSVHEKKQAGISFILLPMDQPGVTVSPIITLGGLHIVNQVTLDDARTPLTNLVGGEGQAWAITKFLLGHERLVGAMLGSSVKFLGELKTRAAGRLRDDPVFRERTARVEVDLMALRYTAYRILADEMAGKAPGPEVSALKLKGAAINQELTRLLTDGAGLDAVVDPFSLQAKDADAIISPERAYLSQQYFDRRKLTIYGGSSEIQKNIIAQRILRF